MNNFSANLAILFPLGSCLYIAMRLSDGQVDGKGGGWGRAIVYTIASLLITFSIAGILFRVGPVSLLWLFAASFLSVLIWIKSRAINRQLLLNSFTSVSTNIARERMAVDFVDHNSWRVASLASRFRRALAAGVAWPKAMEEVGIANSTSEIFSCRCMAAFGQDAERSISPSLDPLRIQSETERLLARLMILPWSAVGFVIVALVMRLIVPTFKEMFEEFEMELPQSMTSFIALSDFTVNTPLASLLFFFYLLLLGVIFGMALIWLLPRLTLLFPIRWVAMPYFRALGLISLAMSIRRVADFSAASKNAADLLPVLFISRSLRSAADLHAQGMSPDRALARTGILKMHEADLLATSVKTQSFPWALEQIAVSATERMLRLYSMVIQLFIVLVVMIFAFFFGWLAIGVIEVLSIMIQKLA